ncbi:hypothetical protein OG625_04140 [Streptomyces sp. NBC_01351]|uniref:hypothetical protein n=1 Tax=Streptomyces sp. NBC_01351 TaxID=2903833 RepID=UPI002E2F4C95|nr:hypothetical protein [Streptomyces sp. NBC_01351]
MPYVTSVSELMDLLYACRGGRGLGTAALLRRSHPFDKELQVAGLVHELGTLLCPGDRTFRADLAAAAVRPLLGERVAMLVALAERDEREEAGGSGEAREAAATLRQAREAAAAAGLDAGVLEDWQPVLELVAAGAYRPARPGNGNDPLGSPRGSIAGIQ